MKCPRRIWQGGGTCTRVGHTPVHPDDGLHDLMAHHLALLIDRRDGQGHPVEIKPYERNVATKIIEDFMLIANETVAEHFHWMELPFVYRTHDNPDPEKISKLGTFIRNFGYSIKSRQEEIHPKELQKLLAKIPLIRLDLDRMSLSVQDDLALREIKINRPPLFALLTQYSGKLPHQFKHRHQLFVLP